VVVVSLTGIAAAARFALTPLVGLRTPFVTFFPAIFLCAAHGGLISGALCTLLSALFVTFFFLPPVGSLIIEDPGDIIFLVIFLSTGIAIAAVHERLHRQQAQLVEARARAEVAAREAEAANRAKDEFLSILSHELRTPLTAVLGWSNVLRTRTCDAGLQARALAAIERNAAAQAQIVEDILDVSRIITGRLKLEVRPTDVAASVAAAIEVVRPAAEAKGVALTATVDAVGIVSGDTVRLQQVAWNLLANAVKFTRRGGQVEIRLRRVGSAIQLTVTDTGEGIDADFLPHVFERFRQADTTSTRSHGGLGLGLAIVKHLVELHGGMVSAASGGRGMGATFTVRLPVAVTIPDPVPEAEPRTVTTPLAGLRVLVVDDDPDALELITAILQNRGADVAVAASTADGLRALEQRVVDVLVADIDMPGADGYALMRQATALLAARGRHVAALALTAHAGARDVQEARDAGFQAHVPKPVLPERLIRVVAQLGGILGGEGGGPLTPDPCDNGGML
jgi:signal transduction histidine kinase/CheY-like chemotaxis protein